MPSLADVFPILISSYMKHKFKANGWIGDSSQISLRGILSYFVLTGGFQLQISEVFNSMKDLIDYSRETGMGPMGIVHKLCSSNIYDHYIY